MPDTTEPPGRPATGSSRLLDELQAKRRRRAPRPGRGAAAPGYRSSTAPAWPGWSSWPAQRARPGRRPSPTTSWWPACCWSTACTPSRSTPRVEGALATVRPLLAAHGGDVELLGIDDEAGAVQLRLLGSCDGCPSSAVTLQTAVEGAIFGGGTRDRRHRRRRAARARRRRCRSRWRQAGLRRVPGGDGRRRERPARPSSSGIRDRPARGRWPAAAGRALRAVLREPIADEHGHLVDLQAREPCCAPAAAATCSSTSEGAGGGHFRAVPDRYVAFAGLRARRRRSGTRLQIPVSVAFFFLNSSLGRVAAFYPGPAGATESELPLDAWDEVVAANPRLDDAAARRRGVPRAGRRRTGSRAECYIVPDRRLLRAGRPPAPLWRGFDGGTRGQRASWTSSSTDVRGAGHDDRPRASRCVGARPEPHAAVPTIMFRLRVDEADGGSGPRRWPCAARSASSRSAAATARARRSSSTSSSARRPSGATRCAPSCGPTCRRRSAGSTARPSSTCPSSAPTTSRWPAAKYLHALGDGEIPLILLFSGTVFTQGRAGLRGRTALVVAEASYRLPVAVWRAMMDLYFPNSGWLRLSRDTLDALQRFKASRACPPGTRPSSSSSRRPGRRRTVTARRADGVDRRPMTASPRPGRRRRRPLRGLRALPVPGVVAQEPGPLAVRRARPRGPSARRTAPSAGRCAPSAWSTRRGAGAHAVLHVRLRCLQVQQRRVEALVGAGTERPAGASFVRSTRSTVDGHAPRRLGRGGRPSRRPARRSPLRRGRIRSRRSGVQLRGRHRDRARRRPPTARSPAGSSGSGEPVEGTVRVADRRPSTARPTSR